MNIAQIENCTIKNTVLKKTIIQNFKIFYWKNQKHPPENFSKYLLNKTNCKQNTVQKGTTKPVQKCTTNSFISIMQSDVLFYEQTLPSRSI